MNNVHTVGAIGRTHIHLMKNPKACKAEGGRWSTYVSAGRDAREKRNKTMSF